MWNLRNKWIKEKRETKTQTVNDREETDVYQRGLGWGIGEIGEWVNYLDGHWIMHRVIESLYYTNDNIILYLNYTGIKRKLIHLNIDRFQYSEIIILET